MADGLLRTVAQTLFEEQSVTTVQRAESWLRRRSDWTTGFLLETIANVVSPLRLVEKSPSTIFEVEYMVRSLEMFPEARFLHLVRHPKGYCESVIKLLELPEGSTGWLTRLATYWERTPDEIDQQDVKIDPQQSWYALNTKIYNFLERVPRHQTMRVRSEDVLSEPDIWVREIGRWLEVRCDDEAIMATKRPEHSPYARLGPVNALYGMDLVFLQNPTLRSAGANVQSLAGPLPWRHDKAEFAPTVVELAKVFGYD
jgi:hypothetical protein